VGNSEQPGTVARRWEEVVASEGSRYRSVVVPAAKVRNLCGSVYIRTIADRAGAGALCLETGCGSGSLSLALASTGRRVVTLDIAQPLLLNLAANRDRLASEFPLVREITPVRSDIERLPFPDGTFDTVFSEGVIEHWIDKGARLAVMREMARVLADGGCLVLFVPNGRHPFHGWWKLAGYPGYKSEDAVPWHRFSSSELASEMEEIGLIQVTHDGISPWSTLAVWPNWWPFRALAALCRRVFPEPPWFRRKFGFNLVAAGEKYSMASYKKPTTGRAAAWACPKCHAPLQPSGAGLECLVCRLNYPIVEGIPNLLAEAASALGSVSVSISIPLED